MPGTLGGTITLLFTDLVRSTELLEKLGDDEAETLWRAHFDLLRKAVAARGGQEVKTIGDAIMAAFPSALNAVACAIAMQQAKHGYSQRLPSERRLGLRIGLHAGEPIKQG